MLVITSKKSYLLRKISDTSLYDVFGNKVQYAHFSTINNIKDANAFWGYDHSDANSRRIFNLIAGPGIDSNLTIGSESNGVGDIVNITPTIAEILGFKDDVINAGLIYNNNSLFDLI